MTTQTAHFLHRAAIALLLTIGSGTAAAEPGVGDAEPPQVLFPNLFAAVQTAQLFPDGKEFADATPMLTPQQILAEYQTQKPVSPQALKRFVSAHFSMPPAFIAAPASSDRESLTVHIDRLWDPLTRVTTTAPAHSSLLVLPRPYVVPGGRFRELYYWDSYFTMLGLLQSGRRDLVEGMVADFAYLIDTFGYVPNGARTYYLSRSQPPFFFAMVGLLSTDDPAASYAHYLPQLRREYAFWMSGERGLRQGSARRRVVCVAGRSILNRYWDDRDTPRDESYLEDIKLARDSGREPRKLFRDIRAAAESGWDFSSRWFADGASRATIDTTDIVPIDLNSLMFGMEKAIAAGCRRAAEQACVRDFEHRAARRRTAIDRILWDEGTGAYMDYRWTHRERIERVSAATLYPLFVGLASDHQTSLVAGTVQRVLLKAGGIVTTPRDTGQQWDSPNGWSPLQWIAIDGLRRYHRNALAATIACRWMSGINQVYQDTGKLVEKYDVVDPGRRGGGGEYPTQDGFGWTNGVMRKLMALYSGHPGYATAAQCLETRDASASNVK